jgi:hypothetical protein
MNDRHIIARPLGISRAFVARQVLPLFGSLRYLRVRLTDIEVIWELGCHGANYHSNGLGTYHTNKTP